MVQAFTLRAFTEADVLAVSHLEIECFSEPWSERSLREELTNPLAHVWVAVRGEDVLGYAGMRCVAGEAYINNVAVFPKYRRQGVAHALMQQLIADACALECEFITLEVRASNEAALVLYHGLGFDVKGLRRDFYVMPTEDGVIMTKYLQKGEET